MSELAERVAELRNYYSVRLHSHTPEESEVTLTDLDDILKLLEEAVHELHR